MVSLTFSFKEAYYFFKKILSTLFPNNVNMTDVRSHIENVLDSLGSVTFVKLD